MGGTEGGGKEEEEGGRQAGSSSVAGLARSPARPLLSSFLKLGANQEVEGGEEGKLACSEVRLKVS